MRIIVTGASRGIGFELVKQYAELGHEVLAISRNATKLKQLKEECFHLNPNALVHTVDFDLTTDDFKTTLIPSICSHFDQVDILINNAGALVNKPFLEINENDMEHVYNVNVFSVFKIIQGLLPYLSDEAHVLNISSVGGLQGSVKFPGLSAYSSSKAALIALTECLAEEYKSTKWSFNCLALGAVQTEMLEEAFPGYKSSTSAKEMANYIRQFSIEGSRLFKGKILNVSKSTP